MSVDFYHCDCCEESIYEEYVGHCSKCGHNLCTNCLINNDVDSSYAYEYNVKYNGTKGQQEEYGFDDGDYKIGDIIDDSGIDSKYCPFCSGERIHNDDLLEFMLNKYNISIAEVIKLYREVK